ncbi:MAG: TrbC/VirB2 family protein [Deltaproteobacteria bacterium]
MLQRIRHPRGWVRLGAFYAVFAFTEAAYAQSGFLRDIESKATQLVDGVLAIAKVVLIAALIFFGVQVARGDREAWGRAIAVFVGILVVFQAKNIIAWIGS